MPMPMASASNSCAREKLGQRELRLGKRQRAHFRIADDVGDDAVHQGGLPRLFFADGGVAREHVPHLVGEHGGELGLVVGERDEAAGHVELPGGQGEGVDRLRIEHGDPVVQVRPLGRGDQAIDGLLEHALQPRIVVDAAIGGEDALMLAQRRRGDLGLRRLDRRRRQRRRRLDRRSGGGARREQCSAATAKAAPASRRLAPSVGFNSATASPVTPRFAHGLIRGQ